MTKVIDGKRYTVNSSTLLADNDYWDGSNFTKNGRNTFLYRTRGNAYFRVDMTCWQGERDSINALTEQEAMELYEKLPEQYVEYEDAFGVVIEEASAGRPPNEKELKRTQIYLTEESIDWLKSQPGGMSENIRAIIEEKMRHEQQANN